MSLVNCRALLRVILLLLLLFKLMFTFSLANPILDFSLLLILTLEGYLSFCLLDLGSYVVCCVKVIRVFRLCNLVLCTML